MAIHHDSDVDLDMVRRFLGNRLDEDHYFEIHAGLSHENTFCQHELFKWF